MNHDPAPGFIAPGKLFLIGEYAVIEGSRAVVQAVDRFARLRRNGSGRGSREDLVERTRRICARAIDARGTGPHRRAGRHRYLADSAAFYLEGRKLGLGSSAAVCACAAASAFHEAGLDIADDSVRRDMWRASHRAHAEHQGARGSGLDLAASVFGGLLASGTIQEDGLPALQRMRLPGCLQVLCLWTGRPASTARMVTAVGGFRRRDPRGYREIVSEMSRLADDFVRDCANGRVDVRPVFDRYADLMQILGERSNVEIVDRRMRGIIRAARDAGGSAKPSGAGGGDVLVACFPRDADPAGFIERARSMGARRLELAATRRGVRAEVA